MVCLEGEELIDSAVLVCRFCLYWRFGNFPLCIYMKSIIFHVRTFIFVSFQRFNQSLSLPDVSFFKVQQDNHERCHYDFHVVYSLSYRAPVLYFRAYWGGMFTSTHLMLKTIGHIVWSYGLYSTPLKPFECLTLCLLMLYYQLKLVNSDRFEVVLIPGAVWCLHFIVSGEVLQTLSIIFNSPLKIFRQILQLWNVNRCSFC